MNFGLDLLQHDMSPYNASCGILYFSRHLYLWMSFSSLHLSGMRVISRTTWRVDTGSCSISMERSMRCDMHAYYFHFSLQYHIYQHFLFLSSFTSWSSMPRVIEAPSYPNDLITCCVWCISRAWEEYEVHCNTAILWNCHITSFNNIGPMAK